MGPSGWAMQGKVTINLWLGEKAAQVKGTYLEQLPPGYDIKPSETPGLPPDEIVYKGM